MDTAVGEEGIQSEKCLKGPSERGSEGCIGENEKARQKQK